MRTLLGDERYAKSQQVDEAFLADNFRHQLAKANPTEAQFRELFKVESDWNRARMEVEQQFQNDTFSPAYLEKLKALDAARDEEFRRVLGADAFTLLQKNQDPAYVQMKKFERLWGLDDDKIDYVYGVMKEYHDTVQSFQTEVLALNARGQSVDADAVGRKLQQSAVRAQQALQGRLGWDSFDKLQRNRVLRWATLASRPATGSR
jgi:hypothetical protein